MAKTTRRSFLQISAALAASACSDPLSSPDVEPGGEAPPAPGLDPRPEVDLQRAAAVPGINLDSVPVRAACSSPDPGQGVTVAGLYLPHAGAAANPIVDVSPWSTEGRREALQADIRELEANVARWREEGADASQIARQEARLAIIVGRLLDQPLAGLARQAAELDVADAQPAP